MCEHLINLDNELKANRIKETYRGQPWSDNTREWVYYDCIFNLEEIRKRHNFPAFVTIHTNDDNKSGLEVGFYCERCKDGVMGQHPSIGGGRIIFT